MCDREFAIEACGNGKTTTSDYLQRHGLLLDQGLRREWLPDPERRDEQPSSSGGRGGADGNAVFPRPPARPAAWTGPREQPGAARHGRDFHWFRARRVHGGGGGQPPAYTERGGVPCRVVVSCAVPVRLRKRAAGGHCALATCGVVFTRVARRSRGVSVRLCGCVVVVTVAVSSPGPCPPAPGLARQDPRARGFRFVPVCSRRSLRLTTTIHSLRNTGPGFLSQTKRKRYVATNLLVVGKMNVGQAAPVSNQMSR
jgi:hypothetical protein